MEWKEKLELIMKACNLKQKELAKKISVSQSYLSDIINNRSRNPTFTFMKSLVDELNINPDWLLNEDDVIFKREYSELKTKEILKLPLYDLKASAGNGYHNIDFPEFIKDVYFDFEILPEKILSKKIFLLKIRGDSMSPTLSDGEIAIVENKEEIRKEGIYIINVEGETYVKRIQRDFINKKIFLISDNLVYKPIEVSSNVSIKIIGEIVGRIQIY